MYVPWAPKTMEKYRFWTPKNPSYLPQHLKTQVIYHKTHQKCRFDGGPMVDTPRKTNMSPKKGLFQ